MKTTTTLTAFAAFACLSFGIGCQAPGSVTGVFDSADFQLLCSQPLAKSDIGGRDSLVVLSDLGSEKMSTVTLRLLDVASIQVGEKVDIGLEDEGLPSAEVVVGDTTELVREDGMRVVWPENITKAVSIGGHLVLESIIDESVVGTFRAELSDGGFVDGFFDATRI